MQIDYALILSAGLGTRMGEIGKVLPKVLWPVFERSLLELQIGYCQKLGIKKIYINTHYLHEEILSHLNERKLLSTVTLLREEPLLDSGGAIHNLARQKEIGYKGSVLLLNADQFLFFNKDFYADAIRELAHSRAALFGIKVPKSSHYNETVLKDNKLAAIVKNESKSRDYTTYSGLGLLKLDRLTPVDGISRFFETVANFKNESIHFVSLDQYEYWDFGTASLYAQNILKLAQNDHQSLMKDFLVDFDSIGKKTSSFVDHSLGAIDLEGKGRFEARHLCYKNLKQIF